MQNLNMPVTTKMPERNTALEEPVRIEVSLSELAGDVSKKKTSLKDVARKQTFAEIAHYLVEITKLNNDFSMAKEERVKELQKIAEKLCKAAEDVGTQEFKTDIKTFVGYMKENNPLLLSLTSKNLEKIETFIMKNGYFFEAFPIESVGENVRFAFATGEEKSCTEKTEGDAKVTTRVFNIYGTNSPSSFLLIIPHFIKKDEHEIVVLNHQGEVDKVIDKLEHIKDVSMGAKPDYAKLFTGHYFTAGYDILPEEVYNKLDKNGVNVKEGLRNLFASDNESRDDCYKEQRVIDFANEIRKETGHDDRFLEVKLLTLRMLFKASQQYDFSSEDSKKSFMEAMSEIHRVHEERHSKNRAWKMKIASPDNEKTAYLAEIHGNKPQQHNGMPFLVLCIPLIGYTSTKEEEPGKQVYAHPSVSESRSFIESHDLAGYDIIVDMAKELGRRRHIQVYPEKYLTDGDKGSILALGRLYEFEIRKDAILLDPTSTP